MKEMQLTAKLAGLYLKNGTISEARLRRLFFSKSGVKGRHKHNTKIPEAEWTQVLHCLLGPLPKDNICSLGWKYDEDATHEEHARNVTRFILDKMKERENGKCRSNNETS